MGYYIGPQYMVPKSNLIKPNIFELYIGKQTTNMI